MAGSKNPWDKRPTLLSSEEEKRRYDRARYGEQPVTTRAPLSEEEEAVWAGVSDRIRAPLEETREPVEKGSTPPLGPFRGAEPAPPVATKETRGESAPAASGRSLATTLSATISGRTSGGSTAAPSLSEPPSNKDARDFLATLRGKKRDVVDPADMSALDQAEEKAKELYERGASRAEWLSVAERIGNSLVRLGAAEAGLRKGVDTSGVQLDKGTDWESRIARYGKEYEGELSRLGKKRTSLQDAVEAAQKRRDIEFEDQRRIDDKDYGLLQDDWKQRTDTYQADRAAADRRALQADDQAFRLRLSREERAAKPPKTDPRDRDLLRYELGAIKDEIKDLQSKEQNAIAAASVISSIDGLDKKSIQKLETQQPGLLGKAGITPEQLTAIETDATSKGRLWDSVDENKRRELIQERIVDPIRSRIEELKKQRDGLLRSGGVAPAAAPAAAPAGRSSSKGTVSASKLKEYADGNFSGNLEAARKFLTDQGFTVE